MIKTRRDIIFLWAQISSERIKCIQFASMMKLLPTMEPAVSTGATTSYSTIVTWWSYMKWCSTILTNFSPTQLNSLLNTMISIQAISPNSMWFSKNTTKSWTKPKKWWLTTGIQQTTTIARIWWFPLNLQTQLNFLTHKIPWMLCILLWRKNMSMKLMFLKDDITILPSITLRLLLPKIQNISIQKENSQLKINRNWWKGNWLQGI